MVASRIFFVGTPAEVQHHAAPLGEGLDLRIAGHEEVLKIAKAGDLAIFFSEHFDRFRDTIGKLKERQVATLYMLDGILEWRNAWENRPDEPACPFTMRPVLSHKVACIGPAQARVLASWGNAEKIEITGVPRFDQLSAAEGHPHRPDAGGKDRPFRILIMTAKVPGFTPDQLELTRQSLHDLKDWLDRRQSRAPAGHPPLEVIWRLTGGLDRDLGIANHACEFSGRELWDQLKQVDALISTPSTGMLEGMLLGLPVASLDYHQTPCYLPTAWTINSAAAIDRVIGELITPSPAKRHFQQLQLADALACPPQFVQPSPLNRAIDSSDRQTGQATARMLQLIRQMQKIAIQQIREGQPLQFPARLLPAWSPFETTFDHQEIYAPFSEFRISSPTQLQVELAHARREILHLQRQLAQVQSELDLAHTIFDQIHRHPVAGPIVRLRQRLLDWWRSRGKWIPKSSVEGS